jgi:hypothetical protein
MGEEQETCPYCGAPVEDEGAYLSCQFCYAECCTECIVRTDKGDMCADCYEQDEAETE